MKTKKWTGLMLIVILLVTVTLTACGGEEGDAAPTLDAGSQETDTTAGSESEEVDESQSEDPNQDGFKFMIDPLNEMIMGSLMLEDTEYALTAEQVVEMLPLWKVIRSTSESGNVAQEELDGLTEQIADVFTEAQLAAISEMDIQPQEMRTIMLEAGMTFRDGTGDREGSEDGGVQGPRGEGLMSGQGGGPGGQLAGADMDPEQIATMQAERQAAGGGGRSGVNMMFLEAFITFLEEKAG